MYLLNRYTSKLIFIVLLLFATGNAYAQMALPEENESRTIENALQAVLQLQPRIFETSKERAAFLRTKGPSQYGFLADDAANVLPGVVQSKTVSYMYGKNTYRTHTYHTVNEKSLVPVLVASIQELHSELQRLRQEVAELKK